MKKVGLLITVMSFLMTAYSQTSNVNEYFQVGRSINFDKLAYGLVWSSHPTANYYKQEYLAKGEKLEKFNRLLMLEVVTGNFNVKDIVATKVAELKSMKTSNPMVNYDVFEKNGEVILDFLVSQNAPNGTPEIVERNVYRYKSIGTKPGENAILLFAVSDRSYGNKITAFLTALKTTKPNLVQAVSVFVMPKISLTK